MVSSDISAKLYRENCGAQQPAATLPPWRREVCRASTPSRVFRATLNFHCFSATANRWRNRGGKSFWRSLRQASQSRANFRQSIDGRWPVHFSHVAQPAQGFLVATIAHGIDETIWVLCPNVRSQELVYESLLNWHPTALFLPEAEFAAVENVLPDPEIAAERLALLTQIEREAGPYLIVATHASLDQAAPSRDALQSAVAQLRRGAGAKLEHLSNNSPALVMSASLKSPHAGNSPFVEASSISIRGRRHYRRASNSLATKSIPCANSTSILKPRCAI